jgi:hypothetical protein
VLKDLTNIGSDVVHVVSDGPTPQYKDATKIERENDVSDEESVTI